MRKFLFVALSLISFSENVLAQTNLVTNGNFSDTSSTAWSGLTIAGGSWNFYNSGSITAAQNMWTNPASMSQTLVVPTSGNYALSFTYIANSSQNAGPYTYSVSLGSFSSILASPIGWGPSQTYNYSVYLNAGSQSLSFGAGNTNSTFFLLTDVSLLLSGPSAADTQSSLQLSANALKGITLYKQHRLPMA